MKSDVLTAMTQDKLKKLDNLIKNFRIDWDKLNQKQREKLEKKWDTEHAYYSSTLEGNGLDKKRFYELAERIK